MEARAAGGDGYRGGPRLRPDAPAHGVAAALAMADAQGRRN